MARLVFVPESKGLDEALAVTLTRSETEALVGMLTAYLDSGDPEAVGMF
jgi:hypothetical protein